MIKVTCINQHLSILNTKTDTKEVLFRQISLYYYYCYWERKFITYTYIIYHGTHKFTMCHIRWLLGMLNDTKKIMKYLAMYFLFLSMRKYNIYCLTREYWMDKQWSYMEYKSLSRYSIPELAAPMMIFFHSLLLLTNQQSSYWTKGWKLKSWLQKFYVRHHDLVYCYGIYPLQMMDIFPLS